MAFLPKFIYSLLLIFAYVSAGEYKFEGYFSYPDGPRRYEIFAPFLPVDPTIYIIGQESNLYLTYKNIWPNSTIYQDYHLDLAKFPKKVDLLVVDTNNYENHIFQLLSKNLENVTVIFTTTSLHQDQMKDLKKLLLKNKFVLLSHWYYENQNGHAIFLKKEQVDEWLKAANFQPTNPARFTESLQPRLEENLKKIPLQDKIEQVQGIDFIYMINQDERPDKFKQSCENLKPFNIFPFRFSAIDGWDLPLEAVNEVGVQLLEEPKEKFRGIAFKNYDYKEYRLFLPLKPREIMFAWGMDRETIGRVLSHLSVLSNAYQSGFETIWVMEDEIKVVSDPHLVSNIMDKLDLHDPYWDILFTDRDAKDNKGNDVPCRCLAFRPNFPMGPLENYLRKFIAVDEDISRIGMRFGSYSMILRRSGMKKILDFYKKYALYLPYDMDFWLEPSLKIYTVNNDIVTMWR